MSASRFTRVCGSRISLPLSSMIVTSSPSCRFASSIASFGSLSAKLLPHLEIVLFMWSSFRVDTLYILVQLSEQRRQSHTRERFGSRYLDVKHVPIPRLLDSKTPIPLPTQRNCRVPTTGEHRTMNHLHEQRDGTGTFGSAVCRKLVDANAAAEFVFSAAAARAGSVPSRCGLGHSRPHRCV